MEGNKIRRALSKEIEGKPEEEKIATIIMFKSSDNSADKEFIKKRIGSNEIKKDFSVIPGVAADLTPKQIEEIAALDNVSYLEHDGEARIHLNTARPSFGVDQAVRAFHVTGNRG